MLFNAAALLTFATAATVQLVDIDPNSLYVDDFAQNYIRVRLTKQPAADSNVYFSAGTLVFGQCATTFTPQNWNQYQSIPIRGVPQFTNMQNQSYTISARSFGFTDYTTTSNKSPTVYPKVDTAFTVNRNVKAGGLCASTGDPHFNTFDNQLFSRQTGAVTRLFKNKDLEVQAWQVLCRPGGIYCNQAVAVRYGSSVFVIDNRPNTTDSMQMKQLSTNIDGVVYQAPSNLYFGTHNLYIPDGSKISISNSVYNSGLLDMRQYMGVQLTVSPQPGTYTGVCNRISPFALPSFYLEDGTSVAAVAANVNYFVDSYAVTSANNLFNGNYMASTPAWRKAFTCALPSANTLPVAPTPPTLPTYVQVSVPPIYDNQPKYFPSPDFIQNAVDFCTQILNSSSCIPVLDPSPYIKGCVNDASLTGTQALAEHHKQAYLQDCYSVTNNLQGVSSDDQVNRAVQIQDDCGLGGSQCPGNCNNIGTCTPSGCNCGNTGYTGIACEVQIKNFYPVVYTSSSSSASSAASSASRVASITASVTSSATSSASRVASSSASSASFSESAASSKSTSSASYSASASSSSESRSESISTSAAASVASVSSKAVSSAASSASSYVISATASANAYATASSSSESRSESISNSAAASVSSKAASSIASSATSAANSAAASSSKSWSSSQSVYIQATSVANSAASSATSSASKSSSASQAVYTQSASAAASLSNSKAASQATSNNAYLTTSNSAYQSAATAASLSQSKYQSSAAEANFESSTSESNYEKSTSAASELAYETSVSNYNSAATASMSASQAAYESSKLADYYVTLSNYEQSVIAAMATSTPYAIPTYVPDHKIHYPQCKVQKRAFGL
ncbi:hypothetical protein HDV01_003784 [Terramyces sp. JEL0728]|nr:hypothetical protein HDV01_003784 [Terramyces sp. JEL0728]